MRRIGIFIKIVLVLIAVSMIPLLVSGALTIITYQDFINKHLPAEMEGEALNDFTLTKQNIKIQAGLIIFLALILVIFVSVLISRNLAQSIKSLAKAARHVALGNFNVKLNINSRDEIGALAGDFNQMVKDLKTSHNDLKKARDEIEKAKRVLEIKVKSRTKELEEIKLDLEKRVQERTKELEGKIEELEEFNKLTIGRELKMIALKEKNKELEEKLKNN